MNYVKLSKIKTTNLFFLCTVHFNFTKMNVKESIFHPLGNLFK